VESVKMSDWLGYEIQEKWEWVASKLEDARRWLNRQNPRLIVGITAFCLFILFMIIIGILSGPGAPIVQEYEKAWYYDLNTGKLFVDKSSLVPPIEAPSGPLGDGSPAGVRAHVFTFAAEPNESGRFIGFLETTDPNAEIDSSSSEGGRTGGFTSWGHGKLIRRVESEKWVSGSSKQARIILNEAFAPNENAERPRSCLPK
jgi:hypothetical protein